MKVNILSSGRFHVMDLARELDRNGFDVKFYSFVPKWRSKKFGLPGKCATSLFWALSLFVLLERKLFKRKMWARDLRKGLQDRLTTITMRKAEVTIAMSGGFCKSVDKAKSNGSYIIIERGSKHILEQKRILESIPTNLGKIIVDDTAVRKELHDYEAADIISIATEHVKRSFLNHQCPIEKLFVNPYGVDVTSFKPNNDLPKEFDLIMVGNWSYQKGCDLIVSAVKKTGYKLLHVGDVIDLDFPHDTQFIHVNAVSQQQLPYYYHQSKVFILPSRQEGLAMVQIQALACNLPIIGSPDSGAEDLKAIVERPEYITIIKDYTIESLTKAIEETMELYMTLGDKEYAGEALRQLSWEAYGRRYAAFLREKVRK